MQKVNQNQISKAIDVCVRFLPGLETFAKETKKYVEKLNGLDAIELSLLIICICIRRIETKNI